MIRPARADFPRADREPDPQENHRFIKNGTKMTGMPAFGPTKTGDQVWASVGSPTASAPAQTAHNGESAAWKELERSLH